MLGALQFQKCFEISEQTLIAFPQGQLCCFNLLIADPENIKSLDAVQSAAVYLALDSGLPELLAPNSTDSGVEHEHDAFFIKRLLTGGGVERDSVNRWFDKSMQVDMQLTISCVTMCACVYVCTHACVHDSPSVCLHTCLGMCT